MMMSEDAKFDKLIADKAEFMKQNRFVHISRNYNPRDVATLAGSMDTATVYPSASQATKLYNLLRNHKAKKTATHTFGALDPIQVIQMAKSLETIYVSGWQCSSTASTTHEPGPDVADYPYDTVPTKVKQLFKAQQMHDRRQQEERSRQTAEWRAKNPAVDYMRPIIADADAGHGGLSACMKLTRLFIENGAAGIHIEDQKAGTKKCGHMGGKVLVAAQEHAQRLRACRLQADIMNTPLVIIARTDAESATFLDSNIDPVDHPFIVGATQPVSMTFSQASIEGKAVQWNEQAKPLNFCTLVRNKLREQNKSLDQWERVVFTGVGIAELRKEASRLVGEELYFDWEVARAPEGYYQLKGGNEMGIVRAQAFAPFADAVWMETGKPILEQAKFFAAGVRKAYPNLILAYNLSPSFNWDAAGMSDQQIKTFISDLGKEGFTWQFITLAGFHSNALVISEFAEAYGSERGMEAYVNMIQRKERAAKVEALTHQKWSGAELLDRMLGVATAGQSSTSAMGAGVTEQQFEQPVSRM